MRASVDDPSRTEGRDQAFRGTWFVVATPFRDDGSLDLDGLRRLVDSAIGWTVDGLTVMGLTSEPTTLSEQERANALEAIRESARGRVPIVVGCSETTVDGVVGLIQQAREFGADGAMVAAPPLGNQGALPDFYAEVAKRGELPLVVQDEPNATGVVMTVPTLLECLEASGARTIKLEDPPTALKTAALLDARPDLEIFGGLGGVFALSEFRRGACGTMSGFAFPEILTAVRRAAESDRWEEAGRLFDRYLPLIQFESQPGYGVAIRKELLRRRGVIESATTRVRLPPMDAVTAHEIDELLDRLALTPIPEAITVA
jgi:4-hydroxy-tetrahydrodipicolinate synthase